MFHHFLTKLHFASNITVCGHPEFTVDRQHMCNAKEVCTVIDLHTCITQCKAIAFVLPLFVIL